MARKHPTKNADPAAVAAAPATAAQLATQPAAPADNAAPAPATAPVGTEQSVSKAPGVDAGSSGQDAQPDTAQPVATAAADTGNPASAAPQVPVGDAVDTGTGTPVGAAALDDDGEIEGLWITAIPEQGFRRCGYRFTREGFGIALDALTAEQIEALENEPNLKVERGVFSGRVE